MPLLFSENSYNRGLTSGLNKKTLDQQMFEEMWSEMFVEHKKKITFEKLDRIEKILQEKF